MVAAPAPRTTDHQQAGALGFSNGNAPSSSMNYNFGNVSPSVNYGCPSTNYNYGTNVPMSPSTNYNYGNPPGSPWASVPPTNLFAPVSPATTVSMMSPQQQAALEFVQRRKATRDASLGALQNITATLKAAEDGRKLDSKARLKDAEARKVAEEGRLKDAEARKMAEEGRLKDASTIQDAKETIIQMHNEDMQDEATLFSMLGVEVQPSNSNALTTSSTQEEIKMELGGTTDNLPKFMAKKSPGGGQFPVPAFVADRSEQAPSAGNAKGSHSIGNDDDEIDPDL